MNKRFFIKLGFFLLSALLLIFAPNLLSPYPFEPTFAFLLKHIRYSCYANLIVFLIATMVFNRLQRFPSASTWVAVFNLLGSLYFVVFMVIFALHLPYSIRVLSGGFIVNFVLLSVLLMSSISNRKLRLALVPFGIVKQFSNSQRYRFSMLRTAQLPAGAIDGLVVDFRTGKLSSAWEAFVAQSAISGIPVYSANHLYESMTGRVDINHLMENNFGVLAPSKFYISFKRLIESIFILLMSPLLILILLAIALVVAMDGDGEIIFVQQRVGLAGRRFHMYKFRTMRPHDQSQPKRLSNDHHRVTAIGKVLRKYRLDELPQLWNVLKGDMSLIGPRPDAVELHTEYEHSVPFYVYRSIVRPGISGWAQVMHGYTASSDETWVKLSYDFYYIKHFSFWIDFLIFFKTIKVMLNGFGHK
jgi:lipopolysaccharide/colanic/teichoic acid biosynthesis glycosyltransferase